jgi:integral membrane protein
MNPLDTPLSRLRLIGFIEGWSFLVLLLVAMPLKYALDLPLPVKVVGSLHGGLFVLYVVAVLEVAARRRFGVVVRSLGFVVAAAVASVVPLGTFALDRWLRRLQAEDAARVAGIGLNVRPVSG